MKSIECKRDIKQIKRNDFIIAIKQMRYVDNNWFNKPLTIRRSRV